MRRGGLDCQPLHLVRSMAFLPAEILICSGRLGQGHTFTNRTGAESSFNPTASSAVAIGTPAMRELGDHRCTASTMSERVGVEFQFNRRFELRRQFML